MFALRNSVIAPRLVLRASVVVADLRSYQLPSAKKVPRRPRSPLKTTMQTSSTASAASEKDRWTGVWGSEERPRFDGGASSPALLRLLVEDETVKKALAAEGGARVLVPGCGRGYDLAAFARAAAATAAAAGSSSSPASVSVVGWDYVPEAVRSAKKWLEGPASGVTELQKKHKSIAVEVEEADFFQRASSSFSSSSSSCFTLAFDYTFFCALPPSRREEWARAYSRLLCKDTGLLITLIFPSVPPPGLGVGELPQEEQEAFRAAFGSAELVAAAAAAEGPPWPVSAEEYGRVLLSEGLFELVSCDPVPARLSHRGRGGRESIAVWRRTENEEDEKKEKSGSGKLNSAL